MQKDANLVEYEGSKVIWASDSDLPNAFGAFVVMQSDGNLVVYNESQNVLWASGTAGHPGAFLSLGDFGQLAVTSNSGIPLWEPGLLPAGTSLPVGASKPLPGGQCRLVMQSDGNLVEYGPDGTALWASGTSGSGVHAVLQGDGNFVVYASGGQPLWASGTDGNAGANLTVGFLGQPALESTTGVMLWEPGTLVPGQILTARQAIAVPSGAFRLVMQSDGNLVEYRARWHRGLGFGDEPVSGRICRNAERRQPGRL